MALSNAGAQYILVPTVPDLGITPQFRAQGAAGMAGGTQLSTTYNNALFSSLASANLRVIPLDTFHLLQEIVAKPGALWFPQRDRRGLPHAAGTGGRLVAVLQPGLVRGTGRAHRAMPSPTACTRVRGRTPSWPTTPCRSSKPRASSQVLTHSASTVGRSRADRVAAQIEQRPEAEGSRWWADVRVDNQRYGDADNYDGMGPTLSFGMDWASDELVFGGFAGYGVQDIDWGLNRGDFEQTDATLGGYLGWSSGAFWSTAQASYTWLSYDVDRDVKLGSVTRTHSGSPDGSNLSLAASAGWDFEAGTLKHGPVVSAGLAEHRHRRLRREQHRIHRA
jgi:outer membrane lipase/esterase